MRRGIFGARRAPQGYLAHHDLLNWWGETFTPAEQNILEARYRPMGSDASLLTGSCGMNPPSASDTAHFLTDLASWFRTLEFATIGIRVLEKAHTYPLRPIREHFLLMQYIEIRYKQRDTDPDALNDVIEACERMIAIAPAVIEEMKREHTESELRAAESYERMGEGFKPTPFPGVPGNPAFKRLAVIRKKQGNPTEAKRIEDLYNDIWEKHTIDYKRA